MTNRCLSHAKRLGNEFFDLESGSRTFFISPMRSTFMYVQALRNWKQEPHPRGNHSVQIFPLAKMLNQDEAKQCSHPSNPFQSAISISCANSVAFCLISFPLSITFITTHCLRTASSMLLYLAGLACFCLGTALHVLQLLEFRRLAKHRLWYTTCMW